MQARGVKVALPSARKAAVGAGLLIVLCALCVKMFLRSPSETAAAVVPRPAVDGANGPYGVQQGRPARVEVDWELALARDPFSSAAVFPNKGGLDVNPNGLGGDKAEELNLAVRRSIRLKGTFLGSQPLAIINGKTYRTGDNVEGFIIRHIGGREIVLEKDGARVVVVSE